MTEFKQIKIPAETVDFIDTISQAPGKKRWQLIELAIRGRDWEGETGSGCVAPGGSSALHPEPSTPIPIPSSHIEDNSEKNNEYSTQDWCKWGKENRHKWAFSSDIERCDLCYLQRETPSPTDSVQQFINNVAEQWT